MSRLRLAMAAVLIGVVLTGCGAAGTVTSSLVRPCPMHMYSPWAWSPDGKHIAYVYDPLRRAKSIRVIDPLGRPVAEFVVHSTSKPILSLQWQPDNQTVAVVFSGEIHTYNLNGPTTKTPFPAAPGGILISPDGTKVVYGGGGINSPYGIDSGNFDGSGITNLTIGFDYPQAWSPDGTRIAYIERVAYDEVLATIRIDGTDHRRLVEAAEPVTWSPDGNWLSYVSEADNGVHIISADGTNDRLVIPNISYGDFGWLPDNQHLYYTSGQLKVVNLETMAEETVSLTPVTPFGEPAWSPDGSLVLFSGDETYRQGITPDLYIVNRDGTGQRRFTDNPRKYPCLNWPY